MSIYNARRLQPGAAVVLGVGAALVIVMVSFLPSFSGDFHDFYMAGHLLVTGHSPYEWPRYYSPVWVAVGFAPLALLPERAAYAAYTLISLGGLTVSVWRLTRGQSRALVLLTLGLLWLVQILAGNIDWLLPTALVVPSLAGIWLALAKPQLGWLLVAVLLLRMPRRKAAVSVGAVAVGLGLSYLLGWNVPDLESVRLWNIAPWPWGLLVGGPLAIWSLVRRDRELALGVSLLISPYWQRPSLIAAWPASMRARWLWLAWIALMALVLIENLSLIVGYFPR